MFFYDLKYVYQNGRMRSISITVTNVYPACETSSHHLSERKTIKNLDNLNKPVVRIIKRTTFDMHTI